MRVVSLGKKGLTFYEIQTLCFYHFFVILLLLHFYVDVGYKVSLVKVIIGEHWVCFLKNIMFQL